MSNIIVDVEKRDSCMARAYMVTRSDGTHAVVAEARYRGRFFRTEIPLKPGEGNHIATLEALDDVRKKAKAVQLTDFDTMERIR